MELALEWWPAFDAERLELAALNLPRHGAAGEERDPGPSRAARSIASLESSSQLRAGQMRSHSTTGPLPTPEAGARQLTAFAIDRGGLGRTGVDVKPHHVIVAVTAGPSFTLLGVSRSQSPARQTPDQQPKGPALKSSRPFSRHRV
jgi:hypothetical protein